MKRQTQENNTKVYVSLSLCTGSGKLDNSEHLKAREVYPREHPPLCMTYQIKKNPKLTTTFKVSQ